MEIILAEIFSDNWQAGFGVLSVMIGDSKPRRLFYVGHFYGELKIDIAFVHVK